MIEIGSEFSNDNIYLDEFKQLNICYGNDNLYLMSGRTAIDFILKDILKYKKIGKAYLPSYCCQSMIDPFENNGIKCVFYDVGCSNHHLYTKLDLIEGIDVFLRMSGYFGFADKIYDEDKILRLKEKGCIIIEDYTHSLFTSEPSESSDYLFASLRKWLPVVCGAICSKKIGNFVDNKLLEEMDSDLLSIRKLAMDQKKKYLSGDNEINKKNFLENYSLFNQYISRNYEYKVIDNESLYRINYFNYKKIITKRINNAKYLITEIHKINKELLLYDGLKEGDVPLFVPIRVKDKDTLIKCFIENKIYCPSHWPKPTKINHVNNIYDMEISLICDQRYSIDEMKKIIKCIKKMEFLQINIIDDK